jgi:peptidoglycan/xylan/chitin deacetylase (PgdA/CDA1 family)
VKQNIRNNIKVEFCNWKYGAPFAYSMTYDEGTVDALSNAFPVHEEFKIPGHIDIVTGQIGKKRECFGSTLNGYMHMSVQELKFLIANGWGVGNHSWSHYVYPFQPGLDLYREVVWSKYRLEDMLNHPVRIFTIPNDTYNYEPVINLVKEHYKACVGVTPGPNRAHIDLFNIKNNIFGAGVNQNVSRWPKELLNENLNSDYLQDSWLYDTTHLVMWNVPQNYKCTTPEHLTERFKKLVAVSNGKMWAAKPDDVLDYIMLRENLSIDNVEEKLNELTFDINGKWPIGVLNYFITIKISGLDYKSDIHVKQSLEKNCAPSLKEKPGILEEIESIEIDARDIYLTLQVVPGRKISIRGKNQN